MGLPIFCTFVNYQYRLALPCAGKNTIIRKIFQNAFHPSFLAKHFYLVSKNFIPKWLKSTFCDQALYITNVCRVISRITKVTLLNISKLRVGVFCLRTAVRSKVL